MSLFGRLVARRAAAVQTPTNASSRSVFARPWLLVRFRSSYAAVVAGAGPAGIAAIGNILDQDVKGKLLWVDPELAAGKFNKLWREVPSNTKVGLFVKYAKGQKVFQNIIDKALTPNPVTQLESFDQDGHCQLSYAADMCTMLSDGLRELSQVDWYKGEIISADWDPMASEWTVEYGESGLAGSVATVSTSRIVLCTGATPNAVPISTPGVTMQRIGLETAMAPSRLASALPNKSPATVAVVGGSHSAILVLLNLYNLASSSNPQLKVRWFMRSGLLYAEYKDGWILYDNTGLKGKAATFAKENLEYEKLPRSPVGKVVQRIDCSNGREREQYAQYLPECTHIIQATGFNANPFPLLSSAGQPIKNLQYDHQGGGFSDKQGNQVPGLYGAGIAFPERVKDPAGNVELAVGLGKFQRYLNRVVPEWMANIPGTASKA